MKKIKLYRIVDHNKNASYDEDAISFESLYDSETESKLERKFLTSNRKSKYSATAYCSRLPLYYIANAYSFNFLITILALTLFSHSIEKSVHSRISSSFTLILTSFSFKVVTSKSLPSVSYLTNLDKYQIVNILFLALCCVWHTCCFVFQFYYLDMYALIVLSLVFMFIQLFFTFVLFKTYKKVLILQRREIDFIEKQQKQQQHDIYFKETAV